MVGRDEVGRVVPAWSSRVPSFRDEMGRLQPPRDEGVRVPSFRDELGRVVPARSSRAATPDLGSDDQDDSSNPDSTHDAQPRPVAFFRSPTDGHLGLGAQARIVPEDKKKRKVTGQDLQECVDKLMVDLQQLRVDCFSHVQESTDKLQSELKELDGRFSRKAEAAEEGISSVSEELTVLVEGCNTRLDQEIKRLTLQYDDQLSKERTMFQALDARRVRDTTTMESGLKEKISSMSAELSASIAVLYSHIGKMLEQQEQKLMQSAEGLRAEIASRFDEARVVAEEAVRQAEARAEQARMEMAEVAQEQRTENRARIAELEAKLSDTAMESRNLHFESRSEIFSTLTSRLTKHDHRLDTMEGQVQLLDEAMAEVSNLPTRRIEWSLRNISRSVSPPQGEEAAPLCWASQEFDVAGTKALRLELKQVAAPGAKADRDQSAAFGRTPPLGGSVAQPGLGGLQGDCVLRLWARKGLYLLFRLIVGEMSTQFEHNFDGARPFTSEPLCFLRDQVNADDGTLRVGIEVLEAVYQTSDTRLMRPSSREKSDGGTGGEGQAPETSMVVHRYVNHRVLDLVQGHVDAMSSRMVKRVEWRIEQASTLRRYFTEGESICSSTFDAGGTHGLQFVFYPLGYPGAKEGFCSFFLYCPCASLLKCWLSVGKMRREVRMSFEQQGYLGRTSFCRFDGSIDPTDDSVLLALEIEEAQNSTTEILSHRVRSPSEPPAPPGRAVLPQTARLLQPALPQAAREGSKSSAVAGATPRRSSGAELDSEGSQLAAPAINSVVKLSRSPGRGMEETKLLPSIWTATPPGNITDCLEGFHTFSAMKAVRRPLSSRHRGSTAGGSSTGYGFSLEFDARPGTSPRQPRPTAERRYAMYVK